MTTMDKNSFIYSLLADPHTGELLTYNSDKNILECRDHNHSCEMKGPVPKIFAKNNTRIKNTETHKRHGSEFDYISHYQADSKLSDYSEKNEPLPSKHELKRLRQTIIKEAGKSNRLFLDAGCGKAWAAEMLVPKGKKVISMDISTYNTLKAIEKISHQDHAGLISDIYNIPLQKNSIDCIILSQVLEHLSDPSRAILSLSELLKPGGRLIITVPFDEKIEYYICVHCNKPTPRNAHLYSFNKNSIKNYLPEAGINYRIQTFSNKYLTRLRLITILGILPYRAWRLCDRIFNAFFGHPTRMMLIITKI